MKEDEKITRKPAVKTTIVGGQPPGNERPALKVPVGIEEILAMAAVDEEFSSRLHHDREKAIAASGVSLTPTERAIFSSVTDSALSQMIRSFHGRIPEKSRRVFLKKSAAALLALAGGGLLSTPAGCSDTPQPSGIRTARAMSKGIQPDRPHWLDRFESTPGIVPAGKAVTGIEVFENFPATAKEMYRRPFLIYFSCHGTAGSREELHKCMVFEGAMSGATRFIRASRSFGLYRYHAVKVDRKLISDYGIEVPGILVFDALGARKLSITTIPADDGPLAETLQKIKETSDRATAPQTKPKEQYPSRGHGADRPPKR